ncbi:hypothetical protein HYT26_00360 [Candidatus Pacearchaeota archaeon]|nr:hypothetical protein [Candidatus Pacearchaeota archaeon]
MKKALFITALLVISVFAMAFVIADDSVNVEDNIASAQAASITDVVGEQATEADLAGVSSDADAIAPSAQAATEKQKYAGVRRASIANGFIVNEANTAAERILGIWVSARYVSADKDAVKELRKTYKNQSAKLREEIAKLKTESVVAVAAGKISVGASPNAERFKIVKKEFTNTSVSFYVLPVAQNLSELKDATDETISSKSAGTLKLDATKYPHLTIWKGTLSLSSGAYAGTWSVTAFSQLKEAKSNVLRGKEKAAESGEGKKLGLLERLFGRKAKNSTAG